MDEFTIIKKDYLLPIAVVISAIIISFSWLYKARTECRLKQPQSKLPQENQLNANQQKEIMIASEETTLPVRWGDLGMRLASTGVIDAAKINTLYQNRSGKETMQKMLFENDEQNVVINSENSKVLLNFFWALGLSNKNAILETGEMANPRYGGAGNFASTGGWTLAKEDAMEHYSRHPFVVLAPDQQELVDRVAKNIYRPCCNNSTHFPDCNHGMAMLGLLELMASQGVSENEMYKAALQLNSFWFPDGYAAIAQYLKLKGIDWNKINPKEILGAKYSSSSGYRQILSQVTIPAKKLSGGCEI
ncbi:hypothetical protein KGQ34_00680 [Patescibacteria group bacterium]|nr:hypothetical protein [Patescibacteria group bacterium]